MVRAGEWLRHGSAQYPLEHGSSKGAHDGARYQHLEFCRSMMHIHCRHKLHGIGDALDFEQDWADHKLISQSSVKPRTGDCMMNESWVYNS